MSLFQNNSIIIQDVRKIAFRTREICTLPCDLGFFKCFFLKNKWKWDRKRAKDTDGERQGEEWRQREGLIEKMCMIGRENDRGKETGQKESSDFLSCEKIM